MSACVGQFYQAPSESRRRTIDWEAVLGTDTIGTSNWTTAPEGLTTVATGATTTETTIQITSGTPGTVYKIENEIVTSGLQRLKRHFLTTVIA